MTPSHEHALIAHISIDDGTCELVYVDLVAGREHGGHAVVLAKAWDARKDLFSVALLGDDPTPSVATPAVIEDMSAPVAAPARTSPVRTPADEVAAARQRPAPDEGADVDDITYGVLKGRYDALAPGGRAWIGELVKAAIGAGVSFHMSTTKTARRYSILRALVLMAENGEGDDDVRALLEPIIGDVAQFPSVPVGHLVGSLSVQEAATFAGLVDGTHILAVGDDGKARPQLAA